MDSRAQDDMEQSRLISNIGFANSSAEQQMGAIIGRESLGGLRNLATNSRCTPT